MKTLRVELGPRSYPVQIGAGLLKRIGKLAAEAGLKPGRAVVITDSNVGPLYAEHARRALADAGFDAAPIEIAAGEASKSLETLATVFDRMAAAGLERNGTVFALGGGVVGDLAGFAAASWMRAVALVQVPTTMVAEVDSSLGGKTGVNHRAAKNLIGAIYQPRLVVADIELLRTLPEREFREGLAEVIKYGAIMDAAMLGAIERDMGAILKRDPGILEGIVERSLRHKAAVVAGDEREDGARRILNFGHTVGHALEASSGYGSFLHGEAVAIGMIAAAELSKIHAGLAGEEAERLKALIVSAGLPWKMPPGWRRAAFERALMLDKKRAGGGINFILLERLGHAITRELSFDQIAAIFA